jgi:tetratricopeptide (TPR) repeat protein
MFSRSIGDFEGPVVHCYTGNADLLTARERDLNSGVQMTSAVGSDVRLRYRDEFRSAHGDAFQHWFERLAIALHGEDCFLPIRVTRGDGGLDGLVLREGRVYQLYAPPTLGTDASLAAKVAADFSRAQITLGTSLRVWTLLHNSPDGKIGHLTATAIAQLHNRHPHVHIDVIGIDGLWERLSVLPFAKLAALFGPSEIPGSAESKIRLLLKRATDLDKQGKRRKALNALERSFALADTAGLVELQAEALISLCLMSSERAGVGDRRQYFQKLQSIKHSIADPTLKVMFHRAHAAYLLDGGDLQGAESAYLAAIAAATTPDTAEECDAQLCVARSEYVDLLCTAKRFDDAEHQLHCAEAYAKANRDSHNGGVFQAALNAGLHWAAVVGDEDAAVMRIEMLESSAETGYRAINVAGQLINAANGLSHSKCHRAALVAAEAALRLCHKTPSGQRDIFLPGVLYTIATIHFAAGRLEDALQKAKSLVNVADIKETASIRFAAAQLVSVISRQIGDLATAVDEAELATRLANDIDSSFMAKMILADSLADRGETERALQIAQEAHHLTDGRVDVPKELQIEAIGHVARLAAELGNDGLVQRAMSRLAEITIGDERLVELQEKHSKRIEAATEIRKRLIDISLSGNSAKVMKDELERVKEFRRFISEAREDALTTEQSVTSLRQANAMTIAPLLQWWDDTRNDDNAAALDYDYWGRGCFARILRNLQSFPHSLNVTIEVRTLEDVKQALRLWALYTDFVLLLWKGPTRSGRFLHMVDGEWFGPWGAGYILALGTELKSPTGRSRFPALGYASWLPEDVTKFLLTEAKPFLMNGRCLLVPASGVGCVSPGYGVMEQLLTEVANCIPAIQQRSGSDLNVGLLPYARDIPLDVLFDFVNERENDLLHMRNLLLSKTANLRRNGLQPSAKGLELEIEDVLRWLRSQSTTLAHKRQLSPAEEDTHMGIAPFHVAGERLLGSGDVAFSPLLTLESMGYGWKIATSRQASSPYRYEPAEGEAIGAWLAPPEPGVRLLTVKTHDEPARS